MVKLVIIGYGHMGQLYGKVLHEARGRLGATLVGVADLPRIWPGTIVCERGVQYESDYDALIAETKADAIIVCTPAITHCPIVCDLLHHGLPILVEKPVTGRILDAECLAWRVQRDAKAPVIVGHLERYNPTINYLFDRLRDGDVEQATFTRTTTLPERTLDVGVTIDLMIHDLDIIANVLGTEPDMISAIKRTPKRVMYVGDPAQWELDPTDLIPANEFSDIETSMIASLTYGKTTVILRAAWEDHKETSITLTKEGRYLRADCIEHHIDFFRSFGGPVTLRPTKVNKLEAQLREFIDLGLGNVHPSALKLATVEQGADALKLAAMILNEAREEGD